MTTKLLSFAAIVATLAVSACADPAEREDVAPSPLVQPPMMNTRPASFDCNDSGRVVVRPVGDDGRAIVLAFANRELQLKSVAATEGQKYSDGQTIFWMNGTNATLAVSGNDTAESCEKK